MDREVRVIEAKRYLNDVLEADMEKDVILSAGSLRKAAQDGGDLTFSISMLVKRPVTEGLYFSQEDRQGEEESEYCKYFRVRSYGGEILRIQISDAPRSFNDDSPMFAWDPSLQAQPMALKQDGDRWLAENGSGAYFSLGAGKFDAAFSPDGLVPLRFQNLDQFLPALKDALALVKLQRGDGSVLNGFALHSPPGENFCGTGERFMRPNLFGRQLDLVNFDAAGVNNPRAYKNIPFVLSSRGYGLFVHSTAKMRLDLGAHSTRSLQWLAADDVLDVFVIGGGSLKHVLHNYRRITGFPPMPPTWSFGVWMSRASYYSDAEASEVARRMRVEGYPADVLHLDVGWFNEEWMCDWKFSDKNFPDPVGFLKRMDEQGFQVSLWQFPHIQPKISLAKTALEKGYVGVETPNSKRFWLGYTLDFTNPEAVAWYQSLLENLFSMGAAAIKADFGEEVDEDAEYDHISGQKYHNLFSLLYQKAVWEVTERARGKGNAVIWARSAWAGSQRYPVHWAGDAAATFDGLAGTICGGLHFGLSGFAFWSHDVGGIHGIPNFMHSRPSEDLYVRWTQFGVFSSHIRYHGGTPREPWEYPGVAGIVREWLRFRYALLPYILEQSEDCTHNGLPVLRSLILDWPEDPAVWSIPDQYLFGDSFLVCLITNAEGVRNVYLPEGKWVDFWSGEVLEGPRHLHQVKSSLWRMPLFVRYGSDITFAEPVENTRQLPQAVRLSLTFDESYPGFDQTQLRTWVRLEK